MCTALQKLDLSYCKQIDDATAIQIIKALPNQFKNISLRFCSLLTGETLKAILEYQPNMEGLDISGCFAMDLSALVKIRGNTVLKCLLLEYLPLKSEHLRHLVDSRISTLSVFCKNYPRVSFLM
jgi:hypothetical protein